MHLKFSQDIQALLTRLSDQPLRLADILAETAERVFSLVIGLLVLPFLFPMPPGLTTILGSGCLLLSLQMAVGRRRPWLPKRVAQFCFPQRLANQLLQNLQRVNRWLEKLSKPRWVKFATHPHLVQLNGCCITWLTLLLMSPIPFTNPIPTVGILLFVVAMLETDGLLLFISYGLTVLITALFGAIVYGLLQSPTWLSEWLQGS
jgi:hypothetical protein